MGKQPFRHKVKYKNKNQLGENVKDNDFLTKPQQNYNVKKGDRNSGHLISKPIHNTDLAHKTAIMHSKIQIPTNRDDMKTTENPIISGTTEQTSNAR